MSERFVTSGSSTPPIPGYLGAAMLRCRRPPRRRQTAPATGFLLATALLSALLVGVACSFGDDGTFSPPVPIAPEPATPAVIPRPALQAQSATPSVIGEPAHPASLRTGIPAIDAVVRAVATHDAPALAALLVVESTDCAPAADDVAPSRCLDELAPGATATQFMFSDCEFDTVRADERLRFATFLTRNSALYAAFGLVDLQPASGGTVSGYSVVFERPGQAWVVHIAATGRVVSVDLGCRARGAAAFIAGQPAEKVILPPPDGMPPLEDAG